jgi:hypothetical protein
VADLSGQQVRTLNRKAGTGISTLVLDQPLKNSGDQPAQLSSGQVAGGAAAIVALALMALFDNVSPARANTGAQNIAALKPFAARSKFFDDLSQYEADDWDGDGAKAIAKQDSKNARSLLEAIGLYETSLPDIVAGADGSICMEWIRQGQDGERKIFVDVGPNGRVLTYVKFGSRSPIEKHFDKFGPSVVEHLQLLFNVFASG